MAALGVSGRELRFDLEQGVLYSRSHDDYAVANLFVGATEAINYQGRTGLGFCLSGFSGDTAVISAQATNLFETVNTITPGAGVIVPWRFRIWAELY